jgi:hypothetical protein
LKPVANQGKHEPQEVPEWVLGTLGETVGLEVELMKLWAGMSLEQRRRLVEVTRAMSREEPSQK